MTTTTSLRIVLVLSVTSLSALAQSAPPPAPPESARAANGEYVAPMQQQTQPSYVPQSVALSGPSILKHWSEGEPIPAGYHAESRRRMGLLIGGSALLGATWLISILTASAAADVSQGSNSLAGLYAPVLGPFIAIGQNTGGGAFGNTILAMDGLAQAAGAAMLVYGLVSPKLVLVRNDLAQIQLTPMLGGKNGVAISGTF